jgi:hypothetical protein
LDKVASIPDEGFGNNILQNSRCKTTRIHGV